MKSGQYIVTDPVVFSDEENQLGLVDWGKEGMQKWLNGHKCNSVCQEIKGVKDDELCKSLEQFVEKFTSKQFDEYVHSLKVIMGQIKAAKQQK